MQISQPNGRGIAYKFRRYIGYGIVHLNIGDQIFFGRFFSNAAKSSLFLLKTQIFEENMRISKIIVLYSKNFGAIVRRLGWPGNIAQNIV